MDPKELGRHYDAIAAWWNAQRERSTAGVRYVERAIALAPATGSALDVGCGGGHLAERLITAGFDVVGIDVSEAMLAVARERNLAATFIHADICEWQPPEAYDLIVAWDSTFHVPLARQHVVVEKLCAALSQGGVLLFTAGGVLGEIMGEMNGQTFYYSSLTDLEYLHILNENRCTCALLERDQYPEPHIVVIAIRAA